MLNPIHIRHYLHAHPELSGEESATSKYVVEQLKKMGISKIHTGFSQHSIVAELDAPTAEKTGEKAVKKITEKTLLFRCELDALPIQEANDFAHKSVNQGVSHKCGHDGHTATMLAFAQKLLEKPLKNVKILLFFQSAEETGAGAKAALDSHFFKQFSIDYALAYHNLPTFPLGSIACKSGIFTPSVESFSVQLMGKKCHASKPADGINPANAVAQIIQFMATFHQADKTQNDYFVVTPIHVNMGEKAYGISAGSAEIGYTIRTWDSRVLTKYKQKIVKKIERICKKQGLTFSISWFEAFSANNNHPEVFEQIKLAAIHNNLIVNEIAEPLDFGEDFGLFTEGYRGAMFGIGSGENCPALHTVDYDFPDALIDIGSQMFYRLALVFSTM